MESGQGYSSADEYAFWEKWYDQHQQDELNLSHIHFVGEQLYRDRYACTIYGYAPEEAYQKGIRITGRTLIEYCIDGPAQLIAREVQVYLQSHSLRQPIAVVDLFAGSGNLLYHIARTLHAEHGFGIEADPVVAALTIRNLALIGSPWHVIHGSWHDFDPASLADDIQTLIVIVDPPWGRGHTSAGLDLRDTEPPVLDILTTLMPRLHHPTVWVIKTYEHTVPESLAGITEQFVHYQYDTLTSMVPGTNVGYLLGITQGSEKSTALGEPHRTRAVNDS
jgi:hypothetical protein